MKNLTYAQNKRVKGGEIGRSSRTETKEMNGGTGCQTRKLRVRRKRRGGQEKESRKKAEANKEDGKGEEDEEDKKRERVTSKVEELLILQKVRCREFTDKFDSS